MSPQQYYLGPDPALAARQRKWLLALPAAAAILPLVAPSSLPFLVLLGLPWAVEVVAYALSRRGGRLTRVRLEPTSLRFEAHTPFRTEAQRRLSSRLDERSIVEYPLERLVRVARHADGIELCWGSGETSVVPVGQLRSVGGASDFSMELRAAITRLGGARTVFEDDAI